MAKIINFHIEAGSKLMSLIDDYLNEFPNDEDFIDTCNAVYGIDFDELEELLTKRKPGQGIRIYEEVDNIAVDYQQLEIYDK
ncbi:MAG: hypothetical protein IPM96_15990 [Ignavibacteria bacterium]|nr:hypothetical protein [Ignavibacteria bacterium]